MPERGLPLDDLEALWDALASRITAAGPQAESVFLTKLVLLLANEIADYDRVSACIEAAAKDERPIRR